jgi:hypothetical protein
MLSARRRLVKVVAVVGALAAAGCFWRDFDARLAMHAELLRDEGRKGVAVAVAGALTAEDLTELLYPLGRARAYAAVAHRHLGARPTPPVLGDFEQLLAAYARLCDAIDRARRAHPGRVPPRLLASPLRRVERRAAAVLAETR